MMQVTGKVLNLFPLGGTRGTDNDHCEAAIANTSALITKNKKVPRDGLERAWLLTFAGILHLLLSSFYCPPTFDAVSCCSPD